MNTQSVSKPQITDPHDAYIARLQKERQEKPAPSIFGEDKMVYSNIACDVYRTPDGKYYSI